MSKKYRFIRLTGQDADLCALLAKGVPEGQTMTDCPTAEKLTAMMEGKLAREDRDNIVEHLTVCPACYEVVVESLASYEELNNRSRTRMKKALAISIPAGLAAAAVLLVMFRTWQPVQETTVLAERPVPLLQTPAGIKPQSQVQQKPQSSTASSSSYARQLSNQLEGNAPLLLARIAGSASRRNKIFGFSAALTPEKTVFRIGARLIDFEVARRANDPEKTAAFAEKLIELIKSIDVPSKALSAMIEPGSAGGKKDSLEGFSRAVESLFAGRKEAAYLRFGSWVEAAGFAAEGGRREFFDPALCPDFSRELDKNDLSPGTQKNLLQVESILTSGRLHNGPQADEFKTLARLFADIKETF
jgi:hypothetical protein